jgi:pimeloyl-ACP methyl ester carboxylesterase
LSRLHRVSDASRKLRGAVVFLHGLGGDAFATWRASERDDDFWPAWLAKDLPEFDIWTVEYEASPSTWLGSSMALPDRAANLLAWFETERLHERPIIFVGHSLGGLVIKQFLRLCADRPGTAMGRLVTATQGVVLLATPNSGSDLASWMDRLRAVLGASSAIKDLQSESPYLRELNGWYRECIPREDIATLVFAETRPTKGLMVVEQTSADPGIPGVLPVPVDADHLSIVKPSDRGELVCKRVRQFVEERLRSLASPVATIVPHKGPRRFFISYRRRSKDDAMVAKRLYDELTNAGHEVFIDVQMTIGAEWGRQIESRIDWCDFLVVLLSAESIQSEMVQEEVRLAHQRRKRDGTPFILPIRIRHEGPLGYALGAYIERYQYALWTGEQDTVAVVAQVLKVSEADIIRLAPSNNVAGPSAGSSGSNA